MARIDLVAERPRLDGAVGPPRIDLHSATDFAEHVISHVTDVAGRTVTLDLAGIPYCNSTGISALLRIRQACLEAPCSLVLANLTPPVQTVLTVTGLSGWLGLPSD
jgi:anti-sigma B factor antagonist